MTWDTEDGLQTLDTFLLWWGGEGGGGAAWLVLSLLMRRLLLHVGMPKSGSTYVQSVLANNVDILAESGVTYSPAGTREHALSMRGMISIGNGRDLRVAISDDDAAEAQRLLSLGGDIALFSDEGLFGRLVHKPGLDFLVEAARAGGYSGIYILLFVRNPLDHALSSYVQSWKVGGIALPLAEFLNGYHAPIEAEQLCINCDAEPVVHLTIRNYSAISSDLLLAFEAWLATAAALNVRLTIPPSLPERINRSLDLDERRFIQSVIDHDIPPAPIADALVNQVSDVESQPPEPSPDDIDALRRRLAPAVGALNQRLPPPEHLSFQRKGTAPKAPRARPYVALNKAQVEAAVSGFVEHTRRAVIRDRIATTSQAAANARSQVQLLRQRLARAEQDLTARRAELRSKRKALRGARQAARSEDIPGLRAEVITARESRRHADRDLAVLQHQLSAAQSLVVSLRDGAQQLQQELRL